MLSKSEYARRSQRYHVDPAPGLCPTCAKWAWWYSPDKRKWICGYCEPIGGKMEDRELYIADPLLDPRPDLVADSHRWNRLLALLYRVDAGETVSAFWGARIARSMGASLRVESGRALIRAGEIPPAEYERVKDELLRPAWDNLKAALEDESCM